MLFAPFISIILLNKIYANDSTIYPIYLYVEKRINLLYNKIGDKMIYPNRINKTYHKQINYANRGMDLESIINKSNEYYLEIDRAVIYKKPTPIGIDKVEYTPNPIIKRAYFKEASTLDYNGIYRGKYIDFDAKKSKSKTSFPISNISTHQISHIKNILRHGGIVFLLIEMNDNVYYLPGENLIDYISNNTRKSIPYSYLESNAYLVKYGINPTLNYLDIIDKLYFKENINGKEK